ncbi:hypothetical protein Pelo_16736 [Pelomyxa schiedti]|nr:hypothetical protein Pelo_16736 [Pelomyxa schiedti]
MFITDQVSKLVPVSVGLVMYSLLLGCVVGHIVHRVVKKLPVSSRLLKLFYVLQIGFLLARLAWLGVQLFTPMKGDPAMPSMELSRANYLLNRFCQMLFIILYTDLCFTWIQAVSTLVGMKSTLRNAVRINFDYEHLSWQMRILMVAVTSVVVIALFVLMVIGLSTAKTPEDLRWKTLGSMSSAPTRNPGGAGTSSSYSHIPQSSDNNTQGKYRSIPKPANNFLSTDGCWYLQVELEDEVTIISAIITVVVMVFYSVTFILFGVRLFLATTTRKYWSWTQRTIILGIPTILSLCFLVKLVILILVLTKQVCVYWVFISFAIMLPEIVPSAIFLFSVAGDTPFFFFIGNMFTYIPEALPLPANETPKIDLGLSSSAWTEGNRDHYQQYLSESHKNNVELS